MEKRWITLNVGGTYFQTSRNTLTRNTPPNSALHRISTNRTNVNFDRDEKGAYMIDRDPQYFQVVLNFLRSRKIMMGPTITDEMILCEAEYFNVPDLIRILKQRMKPRSAMMFDQSLTADERAFMSL